MLPPPRRRTRRAAALLAAVALLASACGSETAVDDPPPDPFAAVRAAREAFGGPASTLGGVAQTVVPAARRLRVEGLSGAALQTAVAFLLDDVVPPVEAAAVPVDVATVAEDGTLDEAVAAAMAAWDDALAAVDELVAAAEAEAATAALLADAEARLDEIWPVWNEPGSRNQQLERFEESAVAAEALADELAAAEVSDPSCMGALERREQAARTVAERTRELREMILRYQGTTFDETRGEYSADPDGLPDHAEADAADAGCWDEQAAVHRAQADLLAALVALQDALNPAPRTPGT